MTATMNKVVLAPNVPVRMHLRYVDVWPNDTTKNNGAGYGASVRLKGEIDGQEAVVYPKGKAWAVIKALVDGGVVAPGEYEEDPDQKYSITVAHRDVTIWLEQMAGQRYADFKARCEGAGAPTPAPANGAPKPQAATRVAAPVSHGPQVPGLDEPTAAPAGDGELHALYRECFDFVRTGPGLVVERLGGDPAGAVAAMTATVFIQACKRRGWS